jgi:hypothetical protein
MTDTTTRYNCTACGRRIAKRASVPLCGDDLTICCSRCLGGHEAHAAIYPDCPEAWHDVYDHGTRLCTHAAARHLLGALR